MAETFLQYFLEQVKRHDDSRTAVRQKEFGVWQEWTWQACYEEVRAIALGLRDLGLQRGEHVAAIGDNDRQYLWSYLGAQAVGAAIVGLYTDAHPNEAAYIIDHCDAVFVLAQDQEQVDKMLEIRDQIADVRHIIYWDENGLWNYDDPWLISFDMVRERGLALLKQGADRFEEEVALGGGDDIALLSYTSGTTGRPKGAILTYDNLFNAIRQFHDVDPRYEGDNHVSYLPMGWVTEHIFGVAAHCYYGLIINFPEKPETVRQNIREVAPEVVVYNSRLWDNLVGMIQVRMQDASWINRQFYKMFVPVGSRVADFKLRGETPSIGLRAAYALGDRLLFGPLRDQLGMAKVRTALTGGAALSPDVIRFFHGIGINLKQVYGMTEVATAGTSHRNGEIKFASVGQPVPGTEIKITDEGEIWLATDSMFRGYYKQPDKTAEDVSVDESGRRWFKTGDAGYIDDDGHLIYLDRLKDMIELSSGARFSPQFIEGRLKFSPFIKDVMAVGDPSRDFVTALIIMDFDNVAHWAERRNLAFTKFADLSQSAEVLALIRAAIEGVNDSLPPEGRVRAFVLMPKEFDADESEMTRSRKLKRQVLQTKYAEIIETLYGDQDQITSLSQVTYQDGTTETIANELTVVRL